MRIYLDCVSCFIRQSLEAARRATDDEEIHEEVVRKVLELTAGMDMSQSPPAIGQQIHRLIRQLVGKEDPYAAIKKRFNRLALEWYPRLQRQVREADDPVATAIRIAIAGNIIDLGVGGELEDESVERAIHDALARELETETLERFKKAVEEAERILYLADNAGEIVFDRLLIEQLPQAKITVAVKGGPIINDATREDAEAAGLTQIVEVIDNGADAPGTILELCGLEFRRHFDRADCIIAKGQGNYETLSEVDKQIFFLLKAKCAVIAQDVGCEIGEVILREGAAVRSCR